MDFAWYKGKKILITGGAGFIGSNLAAKLVSLGADVTLVDSLIPNYGGNLFNISRIQNKVCLNIADVRDIHGMNALVKSRDVLFNLAGTLSHIDSITDPFTDLEINCRSQLSILEACRCNNPKIRIVFAGTRGQYGKIRYTPVDEDHPTIPADINGINKNAGEHYHLLYHRLHGIKACSLRLTNIYGPRHQMKHHKQGIVNWFVRLAIENRRIKLFDGGDILRDLNFINDVVEAMLMVGQSKNAWGNVYNLGGSSHSLGEIASLIVEIAGTGKIVTLPYPPDLKRIEIGSYIADYSKISRDLGWKPRTSLSRGLKKTISYYKKYKSRYWGD